MPTSHIIWFITNCFESGYAPSTISTYVSGISFRHKIANMHDHTGTFVIKKLLEGCRRIKPQIDSRAPITDTILKRVCEVLPVVCYSVFEARLFRAAFTLAYFGLLRVGEIVLTTKGQADRPLKVGDVMVEKTAVSLTIRTSKTKQAGKPVILRIPAVADKQICCVDAMNQYTTHRPLGQAQFFCHSNRTPMTRSQFSGVLKKAIKRIGLPNSQYQTHSFRIGRATNLAMRGVSAENIKKLGRWQSSAYGSYIRVDK